MSNSTERARAITNEWLNDGSTGSKELINSIATALDDQYRAGVERAAKVVKEASVEWGDLARARRSKTYSAYVIAALDLHGQLREILNESSTPDKAS